jgi:hypothetical protein
MLDDVADAIWILSDKKRSPESKNRAQAVPDEFNRIVTRLPEPAAAQIAGKIAVRFIEGG